MASVRWRCWRQEGELCLLKALEVMEEMRCVPLYMVEAVEG